MPDWSRQPETLDPVAVSTIVTWLAEPFPPCGAHIVSRCSAASDVRAAGQAQRVGCFVLDVSLALDWLGEPATRSFLADSKVVLRASLSPQAARQIVRAAAWLPQAVVSLHGVDDLQHDVVQALSETLEPSVDLRMLETVRDLLDASIRMLIVGATVLGRRRASVLDLARVCTLSQRTIEYRLAKRGVAAARSILGWSLSLHTVWRIDGLGWSLKRCASEAGYDEPNALAEFMRRHVGTRPRELCEAGGLTSLLPRWRSLFQRDNCGLG